jgi:hypothetical protein
MSSLAYQNPYTHSPWALADVVCRAGMRLHREGLTNRDLVMNQMYVRAYGRTDACVVGGLSVGPFGGINNDM